MLGCEIRDEGLAWAERQQAKTSDPAAISKIRSTIHMLKRCTVAVTNAKATGLVEKLELPKLPGVDVRCARITLHWPLWVPPPSCRWGRIEREGSVDFRDCLTHQPCPFAQVRPKTHILQCALLARKPTQVSTNPTLGVDHGD